MDDSSKRINSQYIKTKKTMIQRGTFQWSKYKIFLGATYPPFLIAPASMGIVSDAPASALSMAYSVSDMARSLARSWMKKGAVTVCGRRSGAMLSRAGMVPLHDDHTNRHWMMQAGSDTHRYTRIHHSHQIIKWVSRGCCRSVAAPIEERASERRAQWETALFIYFHFTYVTTTTTILTNKEWLCPSMRKLRLKI